MQGWTPCNLPISPKLCPLGDKGEVPHWKDSHTPTLKKWKERMIETFLAKKMLGRLHHATEASVEKWDSFCTYLST